MFRTLHGRLSAVLLALLCFSALLYGPLTLLTTQRYLQEANQKLNRTLAERLAEHLASKHFLGKDARSRKRATAEIKRLMVLNPEIEVYLLDDAGDILAYSAAPGKVRRERVAVEPLKGFLSARVPLPMYGDDPRDPARRKIFSAAPIPPPRPKPNNGGGAGPNQINGYVYIILGGEEYESAGALLRRSYIVRFSLLVGGGILLFVLATGAYLFRSFTRPLRDLTTAVEGFSGTGTVPALPISRASSNDEIGRLGRVFGEMTARIAHQVRELETADWNRREMVSNVSHDLRTPLASLQGYLETLMMKEGQLTPDEQRHYLAIATRHGERLTKLVSELFDLAKLDARDVPLHVEPFSLGELVQDVAQKFQLAANNAGLQLETNFAPDLPFVCADIGMIERVLENLIENALRYTPSGGRVTLALAPVPGGVQVQVRDTGRGIREQDLPHIFERYYRVGDQTDTPGCAGLGLAITRRILELHQSEIVVESTPGQGTAFRFVLPLCP